MSNTKPQIQRAQGVPSRKRHQQSKTKKLVHGTYIQMQETEVPVGIRGKRPSPGWNIHKNCTKFLFKKHAKEFSEVFREKKVPLWNSVLPEIVFQVQEQCMHRVNEGVRPGWRRIGPVCHHEVLSGEQNATR